MITRLLAEISGGHVLGVDMEPELLRFAETHPQPAGGQVAFEHGDMCSGLRMGDGQFDAVFVGDMWLPGMLTELRRVTRPGALLVVKFSGVLPTLTYPWDRAFDLRCQLALVEGSRRCFGTALPALSRHAAPRRATRDPHPTGDEVVDVTGAAEGRAHGGDTMDTESRHAREGRTAGDCVR